MNSRRVTVMDIIKEVLMDWDCRVAAAILLGVAFVALAMDWGYARIPIALLIGLFFAAMYIVYAATRDEARRQKDE